MPSVVRGLIPAPASRQPTTGARRGVPSSSNVRRATSTSEEAQGWQPPPQQTGHSPSASLSRGYTQPRRESGKPTSSHARRRADCTVASFTSSTGRS